MAQSARGRHTPSGQCRMESLEMGESATPMERYVYDFDEAADQGRELLGGKGAGLAEMTAIGIPVPAGFTITTEACRKYVRGDRELPPGLEDEVASHMARLEK